MWNHMNPNGKRVYWVEEKVTTSWLECYTAVTLGIAYLCNGLVHFYPPTAFSSLVSEASFNTTLTTKQELYIISMPSLAAVGGALVACPILLLLGRKKMATLISIPHLVGWLLIGLSVDYAMLLAGRILTGIASGMAMSSVPLYVSECVRGKYRGFLGYFPATFEALGIVFTFLIVSAVGWKIGALILSSFPILLFLMSFFLVESPVWLIVNGFDSEAFDALKQLRGQGRDTKVRKELDDLAESIEDTSSSWEKKFCLKFLTSQEVWWPTGMVVCLLIFQQMTGISPIVNYMGTILSESVKMVDEAIIAGNRSMDESAPEICLKPNIVPVASAQFIGFLLALALIDWIGRRALLLMSGFLVVVANIGLGLVFFYEGQGGNLGIFGTLSPCVTNLFLCVFIAGYSIGFSYIPYIIMSEVFPAQISSCLVPLVSTVNFVFRFLVLHYFTTFKDTLPSGFVFSFFAVVTASSVILILFAIPETKGKTLSQLQYVFRSHRKEESTNGDPDESFIDTDNSSINHLHLYPVGGGCRA